MWIEVRGVKPNATILWRLAVGNVHISSLMQMSFTLLSVLFLCDRTLELASAEEKWRSHRTLRMNSGRPETMENLPALYTIFQGEVYSLGLKNLPFVLSVAEG